MKDFEESAVFPWAYSPALLQHIRRWLRRWGVTFALTLTLGMGAFLGASLSISLAQTAPIASGGATTSQSLAVRPGAFGAQLSGLGKGQVPSAGPDTPGQCGGEWTVSQVSGRTITVTHSDGSTNTIYVSSRTHYTRAGRTVTESAVKVGSTIYVTGTCSSEGRSINATNVEIIR